MSSSQRQPFVWAFGRPRGQSRLVEASTTQEGGLSETSTLRRGSSLEGSMMLTRTELASSLQDGASLQSRSMLRADSLPVGARTNSATLECTNTEAADESRTTTSLPTRANSTTLEREAALERDITHGYPTWKSAGGGDDSLMTPFVRHLATLMWREHTGGISGLPLPSLWVALRNGVLVRQTGRGGMEATILETHSALQIQDPVEADGPVLLRQRLSQACNLGLVGIGAQAAMLLHDDRAWKTLRALQNGGSLSGKSEFFG